jgi:hypothetical protein
VAFIRLVSYFHNRAWRPQANDEVRRHSVRKTERPTSPLLVYRANRGLQQDPSRDA